LGRLADLRRQIARKIQGPSSFDHEVQSLASAYFLAHPALRDELQNRQFGSGEGVLPLDQNFEQYLEAIGLFPWVTACVDAIAKAAASIPVKLVRGRGDDAEEIDDHPILDLLRDPNDDQGQFEFLYSCHQHLGFTGESMITAVGSPEETPFVRPDELWTLRPDAVSPVFDKTTERRGRAGNPIIGWSYKGSSGRSTRYPAEAVVMAKMPHPRDPIRGLSPIKRLEGVLQLMWEILKANRSYLMNGAGPGLIFRLNVAPDSPVAQRFESKMDVQHSGAYQRGKNMYLYGTNKTIELLKDRLMDSAEDAQYIELLGLVQQWILAEYKVPPFMLAHLEHANWSNSVEQQQMFFRNAVMPQNRLLFDSWNSSPLIQVWGDDLRLVPDYSEIEALQPNRAEMMVADVAAVKTGIQTINEIRSIRGYGEPLPWGDEPPAPASPFGAFDPGELGQEDAAWRLIRKSQELHAAGKTIDARAVRWRAFTLRSEPIERRWDREWRALFRELRGEVLEEFNRQLSARAPDARLQEDPPPVPFNIRDLFSASDVARGWVEGLQDLARRTFQRGAEDMAQEVNDEMVPFPADDPRIVEYFDRKTAQRIRTIANNRLDEVREIVRAGSSEGIGVEELQTRLREHFDRNSPFWSRRIARTETAGLYNRGAVAGLEDAGIATKQWLSARDTDVRPTHVQMDGAEVPVAADFTFPSGARGPFPGQIDSAEESINCRCTVIPGDS
jgi:phage portal protein BeeE